MTAVAEDMLETDLWQAEPAERPNRVRIRAGIGGLHCSLCTGTIEKALGRLPGVDRVAVSLTHEQVLVQFDPGRMSPERLLGTLRDIGYTVHDPRKLRPFEEQERELVREGRRFLVAAALSLAAIALIATPAGWAGLALPTIAGAALVAFGWLVLRGRGRWPAVAGAAGLALGGAGLFLLGRLGDLQGLVPWLVGAMALALVFGIAGHILRMAAQSLRRGILNQHVLLEAGAFAGLAGGLVGLAAAPPGYPTGPFFAVAVMVATYHLFSEWLSLIVKTRSTQAVKRLLDLQPEMARLVRDGQETDVPVEQVAVGDLVRVRPGARVPVDGQVVDGRSALDQALVTGEPMPVTVCPGDAVVGGATNTTGSLLVRVTAAGEQSFLRRVAREVEDARALKPGILHLVDRVLRVYTPTVLLVTAAAFLGWLLLPWLAGGVPELERAVFAGLSVLVMGYPCAVGISAPLAIVRGAGEAAEQGVLMRTGEAFQALRLVRHVAFDKTGTLTRGRPVVQRIEAVDGDAETLLALAAAAEGGSEHPLATAILDAAFDRRLRPEPAEDFQAVPGRGIRARVAGHVVLAGSPALLEEAGIDLTSLRRARGDMEEDGLTTVAIACDGRLAGLLGVGDSVREEAADTVARLRRSGIRTLLLTGDNAGAARRVAGRLGIDDVRADLLPAEKAAVLRELQRDGRVAFVGDGINDAPALMQADVGIAMGGGSDVAIDAADVVVLNDRVASVIVAWTVSRGSYRRMLQNVGLAFLFNGVGVPLAATGLVYPVWAMLAMAASVTLIFLNSLWGRPRLFLDAVLSVGRDAGPVPVQGRMAATHE